MKHLIKFAIAFAALFCTMQAAAQNNRGYTGHVEFNMTNSFKNDRGYLPFGMQVGGGYAFNGRFALKAILDVMTEFDKTSGVRDFYTNAGAGLRGDIKLANLRNNNDLSVFLSAASVFQSPRYDYFYAGAGIKLRHEFADNFRLTCSLGARYNAPYETGRDNWLAMVFSIGFEVGRR